MKINPFRMMTDPRGTLPKLLSKTKSLGWIFVGLFGFNWLLAKAYTFSLGDTQSVFWTVIAAIILALPVGYILVYIITFLLYWMGKIFNGGATFEEIMAAYIWTRVPEVFILIAWIGLIAALGQGAFTTALLKSDTIPPVVLICVGIQIFFSLWQLVILFHAIGEVQKFSAWIAVWNVLFAWVLLLILDNTLNWFISSSLGWKPLAINLLYL